VIGSAPVHVPLLAVSVWPTCAVPLMVGFAVFCGPAVAETTTAVASEVAVCIPSAFLAETTTRSLWPTSADCTWYVWLVAAVMSAQLAPCVSQRIHW
jgi:hypothetical protein